MTAAWSSFLHNTEGICHPVHCPFVSVDVSGSAVRSREDSPDLSICHTCVQVLLLSLLFTGYLVNIAAVTPVLQWVHYLSVFFFGFEGLIVNEMSGLNLVFQVRSLSWPAQAIRHLICAPWTPHMSP